MFHTFGSVSFLDPDQNFTLIQNSENIIILAADKKLHHGYDKIVIISNHRFYSSFH